MIKKATSVGSDKDGFNKPELLAPAGSYEKMVTAIHYGADAVYLAGQQFGLRTAAGNFCPEGHGPLHHTLRLARRRLNRRRSLLLGFLHKSGLSLP